MTMFKDLNTFDSIDQDLNRAMVVLSEKLQEAFTGAADETPNFFVKVILKGKIGGDVEMSYELCPRSQHYDPGTTVEARDLSLGVKEMLHRVEWREQNRSERLIAGPKKEALDSLRADAIAEREEAEIE